MGCPHFSQKQTCECVCVCVCSETSVCVCVCVCVCEWVCECVCVCVNAVCLSVFSLSPVLMRCLLSSRRSCSPLTAGLRLRLRLRSRRRSCYTRCSSEETLAMRLSSIRLVSVRHHVISAQLSSDYDKSFIKIYSFIWSRGSFSETQ